MTVVGVSSPLDPTPRQTQTRVELRETAPKRIEWAMKLTHDLVVHIAQAQVPMPPVPWKRPSEFKRQDVVCKRAGGHATKPGVPARQTDRTCALAFGQMQRVLRGALDSPRVVTDRPVSFRWA